MKKNILLTGAAGSVGYLTLNELIKHREKYRITIFDIKNRKTYKKLKSFRRKIDIVWGDITEKESVEKAVKGADAIIHTAALIPPKADEFPKLAEKINTEGTQNLVNALNKINSEAFLIYTSSISVYGDRIKNPQISTFDELKPSPKDYYAETKIKAENYIKTNLYNFTIFRLSAVMSPEMKIDPLFFHMPLDTPLEIVTARNVAFALVKAIEKKEYLNEQIFNLGGGENCRIIYNEYLNENFKIFGLKKLKFPKYAFAEKNFHCGYYKDSGRLNDILHFQKDTIEGYLKQVSEKTNRFKKKLAQLFRIFIQKKLLQKSDPYKAYMNKNIEMMNHFFINQPGNF